MIEQEYKFLVSEKQFHMLLKKATALYSAPKEKLQINHYYDDKKLSLNQRGITVRIRCRNGVKKLQVKQHISYKNSYAKSEESEYDIEEIPQKIILSELGRFDLKGYLETHRYSFNVCTGVTLDMDKNTYWGQVDYEVEIEFEKAQRKQAETILIDLELNIVNHRNKSTRFFTEFERMGIKLV